jgi:serine protease
MDDHDRIAQLEARLASLENHVMDDSRNCTPASTERDNGGPTSRRQLLKLAGAAAVGAAGASLATAPSAGATTGNMQFGTLNDAGTDATTLTSSSNFTTLEAVATATAGFNGSPYAIFASSNGTGVQANGNVYGVAAAGSLAPLMLGTGSSVGSPTAGTHRRGEIFADANAALFQCVADGTPGTWVRVGFNPLNPTRILDTRNTSPIGPNSSINVAVGGSFGVPTQASAVVVNATATRGTAQSFLTIFPEGITRPQASNLNWVAGQTIPNLVTVGLGSGGGISIFNAAGTVDVVLDLAGFYS